MLCKECHQREAKIHLTQIVGEKMTKFDLCQVCGQRFLGSINSSRMDFNEVATDNVLNAIVSRDARYTKDAYLFALEGCQNIWEKQYAAGDLSVTHVSGGSLLEAFRKHALTLFGREAKSMLNARGIFNCEDFGEVVFNLVDAGLLLGRAEDTKDDFRGGYDFEMAFPESAR